MTKHYGDQVATPRPKRMLGFTVRLNPREHVLVQEARDLSHKHSLESVATIVRRTLMEWARDVLEQYGEQEVR